MIASIVTKWVQAIVGDIKILMPELLVDYPRMTFEDITAADAGRLPSQPNAVVCRCQLDPDTVAAIEGDRKYGVAAILSADGRTDVDSGLADHLSEIGFSAAQVSEAVKVADSATVTRDLNEWLRRQPKAAI